MSSSELLSFQSLRWHVSNSICKFVAGRVGETTSRPSTLTHGTITRLNARTPPDRVQTTEIELPTTLAHNSR